MQGLAVFIGLLAIGFGYAAGGLLGSFTGLTVAVGVGSGLAIARAERGTGIAAEGPTRTAQRSAGLLAAVGCLAGAYYGGWRFGWVWAIAAYALGVAFALLIRGVLATSGRPNVCPPPMPAAPIPSRFDLDDVVHVTIIDEIRDRYGALLADDSLPYAQCMYRPAAELPYPKAAIQSALAALLDFVEGRRESRLLDASMRTPEVAQAVGTALQFLDSFLDVPAHELPTDPHENIRVGTQRQSS